MTNKVLFKKLYQLSTPYKKLSFTSLLLAIALALLSPVRPFLLQQIIDKDIVSRDSNNLVFHCTVFFIILLTESLVRLGFTYITSLFSENIVRDLRETIYDTVMKMKLNVFDKTPIGKLTTRTINDVETINQVYSDTLFTILSDLLTIAFVLGTMFYLNVKLTLIALSTLPFLYAATYVFKEKLLVVNNKIRDKISELNAYTQEHLMGLKLVKAFSAENKEYEQFEKINNEQMDLNIKIVYYYSWFFPVLETLISVSVGLTITYIGLYGFQNSALTVGMISSFLLYINILFRPLRFLADKFNSLQMGFVASRRVFDLLDNADKENYSEGEKPEGIKGKVSFKNVNFSYDGETPVLKNVSFEVPIGESLAIVGATGSGKTSIVSVLNRFYNIQEGAIELDDMSIYDYDLQYLRKQISMVLQDVYIFSGTITENIVLENKKVTKEDIIEMAKELEVHDFFLSLPNDYNFYIKERGDSLSHGQLQLLSLFRAIVKNPAVLVLDEATSSIDSNTEYYVQKLIEKIITKKTSIVIAHRLSTIMKANKILVLNKGEVVGLDTHDRLLEFNPYYQKYFETLSVDAD